MGKDCVCWWPWAGLYAEERCYDRCRFGLVGGIRLERAESSGVMFVCVRIRKEVPLDEYGRCATLRYGTPPHDLSIVRAGVTQLEFKCSWRLREGLCQVNAAPRRAPDISCDAYG